MGLDDPLDEVMFSCRDTPTAAPKQYEGDPNRSSSHGEALRLSSSDDNVASRRRRREYSPVPRHLLFPPAGEEGRRGTRRAHDQVISVAWLAGAAVLGDAGCSELEGRLVTAASPPGSRTVSLVKVSDK